MADARWVKSEDAGYAPGSLLLDMANGFWSVRKIKACRWVAALVGDGASVWSRVFLTRREAMEFAEADASACVITPADETSTR